MKEEIEKYTKRRVVMTELLYRMDPLNKTNCHKYIDGHDHLCVLIRLKNGRLIAGYSVGALSEKEPAMKGGIILSLTEKKCFQTVAGKRSLSYDSFFLIFGNSELRLKHGEDKFFTNFGIANGFY